MRPAADARYAFAHDLAISHERIGDVLVAEGKLGEARVAFEAGLAIILQLKKDNRLAPRDLGVIDWFNDKIKGLL